MNPSVFGGAGRHHRPAIITLALLLAATASVGTVVAASPSPSAMPDVALRLPDSMRPERLGDPLAIRWTGDLPGQPGRGRLPFAPFASGSQLDEAAERLGFELDILVGDRGYVDGPGDEDYAIDVIVSPDIDPGEWIEAIRPDMTRPWIAGWDTLESHDRVVLVTGGGRYFTSAAQGVVVEVAAQGSVDPDSILELVGQLPPGPLADKPSLVAHRIGENLGRLDRLSVDWLGNARREPYDPVRPRPLDQLVPGDRILEDVTRQLGLDMGEVHGFVGGPSPLAAERVSMIAIVDPDGTPERWVELLRHSGWFRDIADPEEVQIYGGPAFRYADWRLDEVAYLLVIDRAVYLVSGPEDAAITAIRLLGSSGQRSSRGRLGSPKGPFRAFS